MSDLEWKDADESPALPGYYAVLICYDTSEGAWATSGKWNGREWSDERGTCRWIDQRCEAVDEALAIAEANDIGY